MEAEVDGRAIPARRSPRSRRQLLRDGTGWLAGIVIGGALAPLITSGMGTAWDLLSRSLGTPAAVLVVAATAVLVSLAAAAAAGALRVSDHMILYRLRYGVAMSLVWLREAAQGGSPGNGSRNKRYSSRGQFEADDSRRSCITQVDFGVHWRDSRGRPHRVTWIQDTAELVAVSAQGGTVEVLAVVPDEKAVEARLRNWAYAALGGRSLSWVRRRAHGWNVPVSPRGWWWLREDLKGPKPWPVPSPPSVGNESGAYFGRSRDLESSVEIIDELGHRPLYQYVDSSPTGFAWGYAGAGPSDLARSLLADRLGYVPTQRICTAFREDVVERLPDNFVLTFESVDAWIDAHGSLFARNPRAEPFDPFAAGGAD